MAIKAIKDCAQCGYPLAFQDGEWFCDCPLKTLLASSSIIPSNDSFVGKDKGPGTHVMDAEDLSKLETALSCANKTEPPPEGEETSLQRPGKNLVSEGVKISMIVAMSRTRSIILSALSDSLERIQAITSSHIVVMTEGVYEGIGRSILGHKNIVLSQNPKYLAPGCVVVDSLPSMMKHIPSHSKVFVLGGASLYSMLLPATHRLYITVLDDIDITRDPFFPPINERDWEEAYREEQDAQKTGYAYTFRILERR